MRTIDGLKLRKKGDEYFITGEGLENIDSKQIISLSSSAAILWKEVEGKDFDVDTLATLLTKHYDVDYKTAKADAGIIILEWKKARIIDDKQRVYADNSDTQKAFFELLRSGLWNRPITQTHLFNQQTNWNAILVLAKKQTVLGLVADAIFRLDKEYQPEQDILMRLTKIVSTIAQIHTKINTTLAQVVTRLEQEGIHSILLKGQGVASLYHNPSLRTCGDIDLYVGIENASKANDIVMEMEGNDAEYTTSEKHYHTELNGVSVELHRKAEVLFNPLRNMYFQMWSKENLNYDKAATLRIGGVDIHTPSPEYNAVYIFNHLWHHFLGGGIGLRQLCDWVMVLHNQPLPLDKGKLEQQLKRFALWKAWRDFGSIAVTQLGLPENEFPFYKICPSEKTDNIVSRIIEEGNFGKYRNRFDNRPDGIVAGKFHSFILTSQRAFDISKVSPMLIFEYYIHFLSHGIKALINALLKKSNKKKRKNI